MARIQLYDTTLRDGSQGEGVNFSLQDKLMIARKLDELGFDYIEGGETLDEFLHQFPSVKREQAIAALELACDSLA